ncbi:MAG: hypothetical protein ABFD66_12505 [Smithella sp.]
MKYFKYSLPLMVVLAFTLMFIGCAKPPEAEKAAAAAAVNAALTAGADKYAAADLEAAQKIMEGAEALMKDKKYKEAKQAYVDAKAAFEKATAAVAAGKQAAASQANSAVAALEEAWLKLDATAKTMEKKMQDRKDAWIADVAVFPERVKAAKDAIAVDPVGAKTKIDELKAIVDKWDATFKELAAAPEPAAPQKAIKPAAKKK